MSKNKYYWTQSEYEKTQEKGRTEVSREGWYDSKRWRELRRWILENEPLCRECERNGKLTTANIVDHIIPATINTTEEEFYDPTNLQPICESCHAKKTRQDAVREKEMIKRAKGEILMNNIEDYEC